MQPHDILVPEHLQQLDLAHRRDRKTVLLRLHADLLQRDKDARLRRLGLEDLPVCALAHLSDAAVHLSWQSARRVPRFLLGHRKLLVFGIGC